MPENAKKPQIRFKGFTDAWEQRKLINEVASIDTGKSKFVINGNGNYEILGSTSVIGYDNDYDYDGDFLLTARVGANAGDLYRYSGKVKISDNTVFIQGKQLDFIYYALLNFDIKRLSFGTGQPLVKASELKVQKIYMPYKQERELIGKFLIYIDNLITLHQRKLDKLKNIKKSMLEKMFPKNGCNVPEIRFKGFTDAWEQRKLTDIVEFFSGLTYTPNDVNEFGTLVLRSSNVVNNEIVDADNVYVNPAIVNTENVKPGDIIVVVRNGSRTLIGKHAQINQFMPNTVIGAFMTGIRSRCPSFTNALLNTHQFDDEVSKNMGATINQITGYMFSKMEFLIPVLEEQEKVGHFFRNIDNLITLHQRKLEKLQNIKKACLEKMFV